MSGAPSPALRAGTAAVAACSLRCARGVALRCYAAPQWTLCMRLSAVHNVRAPRRGFRFRKPTRARLPKSTVPALPRTSVAGRGRAPCHQRHRVSDHRQGVRPFGDLHARGEVAPLGEESPNGVGSRPAECVVVPPPFLLQRRWQRGAGPDAMCVTGKWRRVPCACSCHARSPIGSGAAHRQGPRATWARPW